MTPCPVVARASTGITLTSFDHGLLASVSGQALVFKIFLHLPQQYKGRGVRIVASICKHTVHWAKHPLTAPQPVACSLHRT
jgi:hypothetical protein